MSAEVRTFRPLAATQSLAVTAASQPISLNFLLGTRAVRLSNVGTQTVFIKFGTGAAATTTDDMPLQAGNTELFTIGNDITTITVIAAATGSTLYSTIGEGL